MGKSRNRCLLEAAMRFRREYKVINVTRKNDVDGVPIVRSFVKKRID